MRSNALFPSSDSAPSELSDKQKRLISGAAKTGNMDLLNRKLKKLGFLNPDELTTLGFHSAQEAIRGDHLIILKRLIDVGLDVNATPSDCITHLELADKYKRSEIINLLLMSGAKLNTTDDRKLNCMLNIAIEYCELSIVESFIKGLDAKNNQHHRRALTDSLVVAIEQNRGAILEMLIQAGADIHVIDKDGMTLLCHVLKYERTKFFLTPDTGMFDIAKLLLESGLKYERTFERFILPYIKTTDSYVSRIFLNGLLIPILILSKMPTKIKNPILNTLLWQAVEVHNLQAVKLLLTAGANVNFHNTVGSSLLREALLMPSSYRVSKIQYKLMQAGAELAVGEKLATPSLLKMEHIKNQLQIKYATNLMRIHFINYLRMHDTSSQFYSLPRDILLYILAPMLTYPQSFKGELSVEEIKAVAIYPVMPDLVISACVPDVISAAKDTKQLFDRAIAIDSLTDRAVTVRRLWNENYAYLNQIHRNFHEFGVDKLPESVSQSIKKLNTNNDGILISSHTLFSNFIQSVQEAFETSNFKSFPLTHHFIEYVCYAYTLINYLNDIKNFLLSLHKDIQSNVWRSSRLGMAGYSWVEKTPPSILALQKIIDGVPGMILGPDFTTAIVDIFEDVFKLLLKIKSKDNNSWRPRDEFTQMYYDQWFAQANLITLANSHVIFSYENVTRVLNHPSNNPDQAFIQEFIAQERVSAAPVAVVETANVVVSAELDGAMSEAASAVLPPAPQAASAGSSFNRFVAGFWRSESVASVVTTQTVKDANMSSSPGV